MPVADEGQDEDQRRDHQQARRFQGIYLRGAMMLGRRMLRRLSVRLSFWTRRRHANIVALGGRRRISILPQLPESYGTGATMAAYHRRMPRWECVHSVSGENL
jgi:hypothetical protein